MTPAPQKENCIHYEVCSSLVVGGFLGCISPEECKFYHTSASSDKVLEILHDKIDTEVELSGNRPDGHGERVAYNKMLFWIKELRQQKKERVFP